MFDTKDHHEFLPTSSLHFIFMCDCDSTQPVNLKKVF
jgi:hypothetical protein